MKVIFLDVDCLLHDPAPLMTTKGRKWRPVAASIDRACVQRLARLVQVSGALVVIKPLRAYPRLMATLLAVLAEAGVYVYGETPRMGKASVAHEISAWLREETEPVEAYVYLVDDPDPDVLRHPTVIVEGRGGVQAPCGEGLQDHHVAQAIELLGGV